MESPVLCVPFHYIKHNVSENCLFFNYYWNIVSIFITILEIKIQIILPWELSHLPLHSHSSSTPHTPPLQKEALFWLPSLWISLVNSRLPCVGNQRMYFCVPGYLSSISDFVLLLTLITIFVILTSLLWSITNIQ